jgi:hypothetical protein
MLSALLETVKFQVDVWLRGSWWTRRGLSHREDSSEAVLGTFACTKAPGNGHHHRHRRHYGRQARSRGRC